MAIEAWSDTARSILEAIDVPAVYREMGLEFKDKASAKGWLTVVNNLSAAVCIEGEAKGRYRDLGGAGESMSLFDYAVAHGGYGDWREARKAFAALAGVKLPKGSEPKRPIDYLDFQPWRPEIGYVYCQQKDPLIATRSLIECGAQYATYPNFIRSELRQSVIALPGYGSGGVDLDPVGWILLAANGQMIEKWEGKDSPPTPVKTLAVKESKPCLLNKFAISRLAGAEVVWKVEGITDMLALQSCIPAALKDKHVVLTNGFGAVESVRDEWVRMLAGKRVLVIGDADTPGQTGAMKWLAALHGKCDVRNVRLPFKVKDSHGEDVRDALTAFSGGKISVA